MMQPCASAAKLRGGGPILHRGSAAMLPLGSPPPRTVIGLLGLTLRVPDHTTLSRRAATLQVPWPRSGAEPMHLLVDSTGLKLCGHGEWLVEKHGSKRRRGWRKLVWGLSCQALIAVTPV